MQPGDGTRPVGVLLVHVDSGFSTATRALLLRVGYSGGQITQMRDGHMALGFLQHTTIPHVVLMDRDMPSSLLRLLPPAIVWPVLRTLDMILPRTGLSRWWRLILADPQLMRQHIYVLVTFHTRKLGRRTQALLQEHNVAIIELPAFGQEVHAVVDRGVEKLLASTNTPQP